MDILEKLDAGMLHALKDTKDATGKVFPVVIRLHSENRDVPSDLKKAARAGFLQTRFEEETRPLIDGLMRLGGQAIQSLWISRAISARLSGPAVQEIAADPRVKQIMLDEPRKLI
jgi:superfamily I DNA/RNA helicase